MFRSLVSTLDRSLGDRPVRSTDASGEPVSPSDMQTTTTGIECEQCALLRSEFAQRLHEEQKRNEQLLEERIELLKLPKKIQALQARLSSQNRELVELRMEVESHEGFEERVKEAAVLEEQRDALQQEVLSLRSALDDKDKELVTDRTTHLELTEQLQQRVQHLEQSQAAFDADETCSEGDVIELGRLRKRLAGALQDSAVLREQISGRVKEIQALEAKLAEKNAHSDELRTLLDQKSALITSLEAHTQHASSELFQLRDQIASQQDTILKLESDLKICKGQLPEELDDSGCTSSSPLQQSTPIEHQPTDTPEMEHRDVSAVSDDNIVGDVDLSNSKLAMWRQKYQTLQQAYTRMQEENERLAASALASTAKRASRGDHTSQLELEISLLKEELAEVKSNFRLQLAALTLAP